MTESSKDASSPASLSKNLLSMKFMQRQKEQEHREKLKQEQLAQIKSSHWSIDGADEYSVQISEGGSAADAVLGRRSFGNFNPDVEKMELSKRKAAELQAKKKEKKSSEPKKLTEEEKQEALIASKNRLSEKHLAEKFVEMNAGKRKRVDILDEELTKGKKQKPNKRNQPNSNSSDYNTKNNYYSNRRKKR